MPPPIAHLVIVGFLFLLVTGLVVFILQKIRPFRWWIYVPLSILGPFVLMYVDYVIGQAFRDKDCGHWTADAVAQIVVDDIVARAKKQPQRYVAGQIPSLDPAVRPYWNREQAFWFVASVPVERVGGLKEQRAAMIHCNRRVEYSIISVGGISTGGGKTSVY